MSAFNNAAKQEGDWKDGCVKPPKDTRVQTEVRKFSPHRQRIFFLIQFFYRMLLLPRATSSKTTA